MVLNFTRSKSAGGAMSYHEDHLKQGEYLDAGTVGAVVWQGKQIDRLGLQAMAVDTRSYGALIYNVNPAKVTDWEAFDKRLKEVRKRPPPLDLDLVKVGSAVTIPNRGQGYITAIEGATATVQMKRSREVVHVGLGKLRGPERQMQLEKGERLTGGQRRIPGWDFTFSAPKGVSLLWAAGSKEVEDAFNTAIKSTLAEMETFAMTRVRKGGDNQMDEQRFTGNLVWASFVHDAARPVKHADGSVTVDPHLHAHVYVHNLTYDEVEGEWKALKNNAIVRKNDYWEARFDSLFSRELYRQGIRVERRGKSFDLSELSPKDIAPFSQRTKQVNDMAKTLGVTGKKKAELGAATREAKNLAKDVDLKSHIEERAPATFKQLQKIRSSMPYLASFAGDKGPLDERGRKELAAEAIQYALDKALERKATTTMFGLYADAQRYAGAARCLIDEELYEAFEARDDIILGETDTWGDVKLTTELVVAQEVQLLDIVRESFDQFERLVKRPRLSQKLSPAQHTALTHILSSTDQFMLLRGQAGTGKSFTLESLVRELERNDICPVALAPTASASRGALREAKIHDANTLAKFLGPSRTGQGLRHQAKGGLIILDEAGLAGTEDMLKLAQTAKKLEARVLFVGDTRQLSGVQRGNPLRLLERDGLISAELKEIIRQPPGKYRDVVIEMAMGRAVAGLSKAKDFNFVTEVQVDPNHPADEIKQRGDELAAKAAAQHVVMAYQQRKSCIVVAPTHDLGGVVTEATRQTLQARGLIEQDEATFPVLRPVDKTAADRRDLAHSLQEGDLVVMQRDDKERKLKCGDILVAKEDDRGRMQLFREDWEHKRVADGIDAEACGVYRREQIPLAVGDQVRATEAIRESKMERGDRGVIAEINRWQNTVTLTDGRVVSMDCEHLDYGYVVTVFGSQGQSVKHCVVVATSSSLAAMSKEAMYVAASRGQEKLQIITDDVNELTEALGRSMAQDHAIDIAFEAVKQDRLDVGDELSQRVEEIRRRTKILDVVYEEDQRQRVKTLDVDEPKDSSVEMVEPTLVAEAPQFEVEAEL
ncbi:MAG: MobF family relaxase [Myxococcota bacterium]